MEEETAPASIYKAARTIKRKENSLYNALRSIYEDSIFVGEIALLWPELPLIANLRCGLWYSPPSRFHSSSYFKSTDGHSNNLSFNTSRLNLHLPLLAGDKGGCIVVDSTRKGKRFPDSMSKTIPIWTCVLNRSIRNHLAKINADRKDGWDCSLHLPLWVSKTEKASIERRLDEWTEQLEESGADIASLAACLRKPLRPLWISQRSVIWLNQVPDHDSWDFTPIILVSASSSTGVAQIRTSSEHSWKYIAGAGDDEESWARGLSPALFWSHVYEIVSAAPESCNQMVADIVEKDRVCRARRGQTAPQLRLNPPKLRETSARLSDDEPSPFDEHGGISWVGSTSLAVGSVLSAVESSDVDCVINCDKESIAVFLPESEAYLHLPVLTSKFDRFSLLKNLPNAVDFANANLSKGKRILVCCSNGEDISICVCLAILISLFDDEGMFDGGKFFSRNIISKWEMKRRMVVVCKFAASARPSRGNLRQVFSFLNGGRAGSEAKTNDRNSVGDVAQTKMLNETINY